ncbi:hypothetical protein H6F74_15375 [Trichocoleus sp. FACHB-90]|uniref:NACHT C-terminal helical domain 2-containing protein n=1 Tax=Cyanophyceae TaxID=3028117 RepID=UPI00168848A3|nr:hypothetical protein [Trichocoleus sp. FACHB-90]MBD1927613.1 hypothetical protein [Trichocoleus sp. FACHB-90]
MNKDEYVQAMKQEIDESIKEDEKIQHFLVWLHEKTASLGSPYQESALRAFYCDIVEGTSVNREISRMLDSNLDKDIDEVRGIANQFRELWDNGQPVARWVYEIESREPAYSRFPQINFKRLVNQVDTSPAVDIVVDRNLALVCKMEAVQKEYARQAIALLIRESDKDFLEKMIDFTNIFTRVTKGKESNVYFYEEDLKEWKSRLTSWLFKYRNLKLDWQFSDEQKQLLNNYYAANKLLVYCLKESNASPEVQKEIQETLLLPIAEIEKRKWHNGKGKLILSGRIVFSFFTNFFLYCFTTLFFGCLLTLIIYRVFVTVFKPIYPNSGGL